MIKFKSIAALIALAIAVLIFTPFIAIWGLNTLFPALAIPYNFYTWLAVIALKFAAQTQLSFKT